MVTDVISRTVRSSFRIKVPPFYHKGDSIASLINPLRQWPFRKRILVTIIRRSNGCGHSEYNTAALVPPSVSNSPSVLRNWGTRLHARVYLRVTGRTRWPNRSTYKLVRPSEAFRQPDLLLSPVIIIIKSTLRAVRALVKECFISPTRHSASAHWTAFRQPLRLQHHLRKTTLVSALRACRPHLSFLPSHNVPFDILRTLKPAEGCFLPFV